MEVEENKVLDCLLKRYKHYLRIRKSSKSTMIILDGLEELEKILKHLKIDINEM